MKNILHNNPGFSFIALVAVLSTVPYSFMIHGGTKDSPWTMVLMWIPALAAVIMRLLTRKSLFRGLGWNIFRQLHLVLLLALVPLAVDVATTVIALWFGFGEWNPNFILVSNSLISIKKVALLFGAGEQNISFFVLNFLLSFWVGTLLYMLAFAFGEEYGWRGYLQQHLTSKYGLYKGLAVLGIVWGYWHLPGALFLGLNYPEYPVLGGLVLMPLLMLAFSFVFGLLYIKHNIIWIPAMLHAALNVSAGIANKAILKETKNTLAIDLTWTVLWLFVAAAVILVVRRINSAAFATTPVSSTTSSFTQSAEVTV